MPITPTAPLPFPLPADDRALSPHTGLSRAHWEAAADGMLRAALRYATPGHGLIDLPGPPSRSGVRPDGLEGFARTFLLAALRVAGAGGADPYSFLPRYPLGLRVHRTVNVPAGTAVHHSGWAVAVPPGTAAEQADGAGPAGETCLAGAAVTGRLLPLHGWRSSAVRRAPQGTAYGPWAWSPNSPAPSARESGTVFAALASLTADPEAPPLTGLVTAEVSGEPVTARWPDGGTTVVDFGGGPDGDVPRVTEETA